MFFKEVSPPDFVLLRETVVLHLPRKAAEGDPNTFRRDALSMTLLYTPKYKLIKSDTFSKFIKPIHLLYSRLLIYIAIGHPSITVNAGYRDLVYSMILYVLF